MFRRFLIAAFCAWFALSPALGGTTMLLGAGAGAPTATYQGPGDVKSGAIFFHSCRAYSAAKAGTKAYRIVRASDSTQTDINSLASGLCDTSTPATFCASTTCKIVTYYDQSGSNACTSAACNVTQGTDANRPVWTANVKNGWPCFDATSGSGKLLTSVGSLIVAQPYSFLAVAERTGATTTAARIVSINDTSTEDAALGFRNSTNLAGAQAGVAITQTATDSAFHTLIGVVNGVTNSVMVVDGSAGTAGSAGTQTLSKPIVIGTGPGSSPLTGYACESMGYVVALTPTEYGNLDANMRSATNGWNF